jgi:hypothetical protein
MLRCYSKLYLAGNPFSFQVILILERISFSLIFALLLFSCAGTKAIRKTEVPENFSMKLERTICFGRCPAYSLTVNSAGEVAYKALRFAPDSVRVPTRLSKIKLKEIVYLLKQADLPQYKDRYDAEVSDLPAKILQCKMEDLDKSIFMRYRTPARLDSLVSAIEHLIFKKELAK